MGFWSTLHDMNKSNAADRKVLETYRNKARKTKADNKLGKLQHSSIEHKIGVKHSGTVGIELGAKTK